MPELPRVLIADDHPIVRNGLRISIEGHVRVVGEAADGIAALSMIAELQPDIAVLDIEMPHKRGLDVAREAQQVSPGTRIVFFSLHKDRDLFQAAIQAGASGYLLKDDTPETILEGLQAVSSGRIYFSSSLVTEIARPVSETETLLKTLTSTERHIVTMIASGKTSKAIAEALCLHYRTIENHRTNICRKLHLSGSNALLRFALQCREQAAL